MPRLKGIEGLAVRRQKQGDRAENGAWRRRNLAECESLALNSGESLEGGEGDDDTPVSMTVFRMPTLKWLKIRMGIYV